MATHSFYGSDFADCTAENKNLLGAAYPSDLISGHQQ
jgi:hypothetical protein